MKKSIYYFITALVLIAGCKKMDDTYKQFVIPGGVTYVERAKNVSTFTGLSRIKFVWSAPVDPNVTKARIYWNNYADSVELSIPPNIDSVSYFLNIPEGIYSFVIRTFDELGNRSVPVEIQGRSVGQTFLSNMFNRPLINSFIDDANGVLKFTWGAADTFNGSIGLQLNYTSKLGNEKKLFIDPAVSESAVEDYKEGTSISYTTLYLADTTSIDTLKTERVLIEPRNVVYRLDRSKFAPLKLAGDANEAWGWAMRNMWDGNTNAEPGFHTADAAMPQHISFDLGVTNRSLYSFRTWQRQGQQYLGGNMKRFSLWGSNILAPEWSNWTKLGDFTSGTHNFTQGELFMIPEGAGAYRYIRIQVQEAWDGKAVGSFHIMEIELMANFSTP